MVAFDAKIDSSGLRNAIAWRREVLSSKRTMRQIVTSAAMEVAVNAAKMMPFVDPARINQELSVTYSPGRTKTGKMSIQKSKRIAAGGPYGVQRTNPATFGRTTATVRRPIPLAALIIQASVLGARSGKDGASQPGMSKYNRTTNMRYARPYSPFYGKTRQAGQEAMRAAVNRMIKARRSSTHFLQSGWNDAIAGLSKETANRGRSFMRGVNAPKGLRGSVVIRDDGYNVSVQIENSTGMSGVNARNFNSALWRYGAGALQTAVDDEAAKMVAYTERKMNADNAAFNAMR